MRSRGSRVTRARLLIVDDEEPMARRLCESLEAAGYAARFDCSPDTTLDTLRDEQVDLAAVRGIAAMAPPVPRVEVPAAADRPAHEEPEGREHLRQRPSLPGQHDPDPDGLLRRRHGPQPNQPAWGSIQRC